MNHQEKSKKNGSKNKIFHKLSKGKVEISGSIQAVSIKNPNVGPDTIKFELRNKTSGNSFVQ